MPYSVGKSSYPDLYGVTQYVATVEIAAQVASLCYEFDTQVAQGGDRLTVNEGIRSHERQDKLYHDMLYNGGVLAAKPYTSTHDASRGSALDFGITRPDGSNRALTPAEFAWLHTRAPQRGIRWTGAGFSRVEPWHHNGGYPASVPPIAGVNVPGAPIPEVDDLFDENDRKRQERIEALLTELKPMLVQANKSLGANPKESASEVWKYGIEGYNGTHEARKRLAGIDAGKASTQAKTIVAGVVAGIAALFGKPAPDAAPGPQADEPKETI